MASVIIGFVLFAVMAAFIFDKNDMDFILAIFMVGLLGAWIGLETADLIGAMANEQNSKTICIEQIELSSYINTDNIFFTENNRYTPFLYCKSIDISVVIEFSGTFNTQ